MHRFTNLPKMQLAIAGQSSEIRRVQDKELQKVENILKNELKANIQNRLKGYRNSSRLKEFAQSSSNLGQFKILSTMKSITPKKQFVA